MDLSDRDTILKAITKFKPDAIVHSGAYTAVDACESNVDLAMQINALSTRHIVDAAGRVGARVLYLSTDYVFDGTKEGPYNEWDLPNPRTVYGLSKLGGERELRPEDTIVRTSWVFGRNGKNMVKTVLRLIESQPELAFVNDQHGKPTCAEDLAETIYDLTVGDNRGLFHVTNSGETTWFDFVQEIVRMAGEDPNRVKPTTTAALADRYPAPRPANSVLDNAALRLSGLPELRHYTEALAETIKAIKAG